MARDRKNIYQETPKQIRQKVVKFQNIPQQFAVYAKERGLLGKGEEVASSSWENTSAFQPYQQKDSFLVSPLLYWHAKVH